jgi:hypothetical protein
MVNDAPTLRATPDGDGGWRVWCPHCRRDHIHGAGEGHRAAHCADPESPYRLTGYRLALTVAAS